MNMSVTYWLNREDKERCFQIRRRGTVFEKEPAYITAYEVCKGLNEYYSNGKMNIPIRDAHTGKRFHDLPLTATVDKMIKWLRDNHDIFYIKAINLCIPLEDPLSMRVKRFWEGEDERQKQIEEYCTNDCKSRSMAFIEELWKAISDEPVPDIKTGTDQLQFYKKVLRTVVKCKNDLRTLREDYDSLNKSYDQLWEDRERKKIMLNSFYGDACGTTADVYGEVKRLKKERDEFKERLENLEYGGYVCSGCKRTTCGYFSEVLSSLGIRDAVVYPSRGQSKVETLAKLANERAKVIFSEHQRYQKQIDKLNERIHNQEQIIKTQNESLTKQRKQLKDLGVALRNVKDVTDSEMDDLMKTHGDDIIPVF